MRQINLDLQKKMQLSGANVSIYAQLNDSSYFNYQFSIGEKNHITRCFCDAYTSIGHHSKIQLIYSGRYCTIGSDVCIGLGIHNIDDFSTTNALNLVGLLYGIDRSKDKKHDLHPFFNRLCYLSRIGHDVFIGDHVIAINDIEIHNGAVIMPNSIITKDVPAYAIVSGKDNIIGYRYSDEVISDLQNLKWWNLDLPQMLKQGIKIPNNNIYDFIQCIKDLDPKDKIMIPQQWTKVKIKIHNLFDEEVKVEPISNTDTYSKINEFKTYKMQLNILKQELNLVKRNKQNKKMHCNRQQ